MNTAFVLDYCPYLATKCPKSFALYILMDKFKNDNNLIKLTYEDIRGFFGWSNPTITKAVAQLREFNLIDDSKKKSVFEVKNPQALSNEKRVELYDGIKVEIDNDLRKRLIDCDNLPSGFEKLLDSKEMFEAYTVLGKERFNIAKQIAKYFEIDYNTLKCYLENQNFTKKFKKIRTEVKKAAKIAGMRVTKKGSKKKSKLTVAELTQQLLEECHLDSSGLEIPKEKWKTPQLLRYYCLLYKEVYKKNYVFTSNPFSSKESRDMYNIYEAHSRDSLLCIKYLEWALREKSKSSRITNTVGTGLCAHSGVIREFMDKISDTQFAISACKKTDLVPEELTDWIEDNMPNFLDQFDCRVMDHLYWFKEAYNNGDASEEMQKVVEQAIQMKILPTGKENLRFV